MSLEQMQPILSPMILLTVSVTIWFIFISKTDRLSNSQMDTAERAILRNVTRTDATNLKPNDFADSISHNLVHFYFKDRQAV